MFATSIQSRFKKWDYSEKEWQKNPPKLVKEWEESIAYMKAVALNDDEKKPILIEDCIGDAIHTVEAWEKGTAEGIVFRTEYAKRLANYTPEERRKYLQHQMALLNRHPEWNSALRRNNLLARQRMANRQINKNR